LGEYIESTEFFHRQIVQKCEEIGKLDTVKWVKGKLGLKLRPAKQYVDCVLYKNQSGYNVFYANTAPDGDFEEYEFNKILKVIVSGKKLYEVKAAY
jgi:hypothetical protein